MPLLRSFQFPLLGKRWLVFLLSAFLLAALCSLAATHPVAAASQNVVRPESGGCCWVVHTATGANTAFDYTNITESFPWDSTAATDPTHLLQVTPLYDPGAGSVLDPHPVGVWYNGSAQLWSIFNEDGATMPVGATFYVYDWGASWSEESSGTFLQTATASNSTSDYTDISNPVTDNQPSNQLIVTPNWNPGGVGAGVYDPHPLGVWYHNGHWSIFHEDGTAIPLGASYNVISLQPSWNETEVFQATASNSAGNLTKLNTWGLLVTQEWVPTTCSWYYCHFGSSLNNAVVGLEYDDSLQQWEIFNENGATMPTGSLLLSGALFSVQL